jgi:predicted alpha/beta-hydrolase family hydrolase
VTEFLFDGPEDAGLTVVLAHGAGAPMDSAYMNHFARGIGAMGYRCARFEFGYMAKRRTEGKRGGPDPQPRLLDAWRTAAGELGAAGSLVVGGKSMGGRMASMVADELGVAGLVCLGYPFHAPGRPESPRIAHLQILRTPALILQGTRDPFGGEDEVGGYGLSGAIRVHWLGDGDHDLKPRKDSGRTQRGNWDEALEAIREFLAGIEA